MVSFDQFRQELLAQMELAAGGGANHVNINSNELHFVIGIVPLRVSEALCGDVMQKEMKSGDRMLGDVGAGAGAVSIRYLLPRGVLS